MLLPNGRNKMKFENIAEIGQKIRAYDFQPMPSRDDQFIEGVVVDKGWVIHPETGRQFFKGYTISIDADSSEGSDRIGDTGYVPFETSFDFDARVEIIA